jgi:hypothetical protein
VISPFAKPSHLEPTVYDLVSVLKFLETNFGRPTLASMKPPVRRVDARRFQLRGGRRTAHRAARAAS